ncbi:MAG TPA: hypothetical protein VMZ28_03610 [Kofleriaceae bacterium]|nr:hypothetical protein [Kofleriaceae bacterium]
MARDTMKGEKNKQPAAKARMNQGGASMPGKASARAQSMGAEKDTRAKTGTRKAAGKAGNRRPDRKAPAAARKSNK